MNKKNPSTSIFIGMGTGILFGFLINLFASETSIQWIDRNILHLLGMGFIKLIQFIVVPLVLVSLVVSMSGIKDIKKVGRYSVFLLVLYIFTSVVSIGIGIGVAHLFKPGIGIELITQEVQMKEGIPLNEWFLSSIPNNPFSSMSNGNMIQIILTAILVGLGITAAGEKGKPFLQFFESANEVVLNIMQMILRLAPIGVFGLISSVIATQGFEVIKSLSLYVLGLIIAILIMGILVYSFLLIITGQNPIFFWKSFYSTLGLAFGTASSNAALPLAMKQAENNYGMKQEIASFAIPFGTSLKKDGAAILQGFTAIFVAQMININLSISQYFAIIISSIIVSLSTAGVPGAGIIMMSTVLSAAGLPLEGIAIIAGIDRLTDMFRTTLNVTGIVANAAILDKFEKRRVNRDGPIQN